MADLVIIGGGIQGLSLAYHLAVRGLTDVCVLEMNSLGSGSSGRSAAVIGHAFPNEDCLPLVRYSFAAIQRFAEEMEADPGWEPIGTLLLAGAQGAESLRRRHALLLEQGVASELVDRQAIDRLTPGLNLEDIELGWYGAGEGCIDPHSLMMAYATQARRRGVRLVEGVRALGLEIRGDRVTGVRTLAGTISTPCVVNAAGFNGRQVASWAGFDLPITNIKRHIFCTGPVPGYDKTIPFTYEVELPWYLRREGPGLLIGMGNTPSDEEDPQVDWAFLDEVIEHSIYRAPGLAEAGVKTAWAGLRPVTPDDSPILGPAEQLQGFWNDCGWGGHGIMHAPAGGAILAEWILDGRCSTIEAEGFRSARFATAGYHTAL
jgi:sarcosine oxidase subunit beta